MCLRHGIWQIIRVHGVGVKNKNQLRKDQGDNGDKAPKKSKRSTKADRQDNGIEQNHVKVNRQVLALLLGATKDSKLGRRM